jgi:putative phosphoesterase
VRIGLISDTHIFSDHEELYPEVYDALRGVELILHAGDIYVLSVLDRLERIAPVLAARGNGDWRLPNDPRLKDAHVIELAGLRIGLTHDLPLPELPPERTLEKTMARKFGGPVDVIVFGDTHVAQVEVLKGVLLVNPGSPTYPSNYQKQHGTVGMLEVVNGAPQATLIPLTEAAQRFLPRR